MDQQSPFCRNIVELTVTVYRVTDFFAPTEPLRAYIRNTASEIVVSVFQKLYNQNDTLKNGSHLSIQVEKINALLDIAACLRIVHRFNFLVLQREYRNFLKQYKEAFALMGQEDASLGKEKKDIHHNIHEDAIGNNIAYRMPSAGESMISSIPRRIEKGQNDRYTESHTSNGHHIQRTNISVNQRQQIILGHLQKMPEARVSDFYKFFHGISSKTIQRDLQDLVQKHFLKKEGEKRWTIYSLGTDA